MTTKYYKPNDAVNKNGIEIDDSWPVDVQQMQRELAKKNGYLPLVEIGSDDTSAFAHSTFTISPSKDDNGNPIYIKKWKTRKIEAHLSMSSVMEYLKEIGLLEQVMKAIYSDSALSDWWVNKRTYTKDSKESKALSKRLGVPEEILEDMALKCREVRK